jgi:hypothetical protein
VVERSRLKKKEKAKARAIQVLFKYTWTIKIDSQRHVLLTHLPGVA